MMIEPRFRGYGGIDMTRALPSGSLGCFVSERLGHARVSLTLDVYSHAVPHMQQEAALRI
jgi:integrase